jgi:hypothetical protein
LRFGWAFVDPGENRLATFEARDMALPHVSSRVTFQGSSMETPTEKLRRVVEASALIVGSSTK